MIKAAEGQVQAEWGEITLPSPGRLGRAAARNAGRVAKPPYRQERSDPQSPWAKGEGAAIGEDAIALITSGGFVVIT
jgi:hypothetical protein